MSPRLEYLMFEKRLLDGRSLGTLDETSECTLLDAMDDLWWRMTDNERAEANLRPVTEILTEPSRVKEHSP